MMKDTGGSAFPVQKELRRDGITEKAGSDGMTLRDYFAGEVRKAIGTWTPFYKKPELVSGPDQFEPWKSECDRLEREARAAYCYAEADAMIAERSKP